MPMFARPLLAGNASSEAMYNVESIGCREPRITLALMIRMKGNIMRNRLLPLVALLVLAILAACGGSTSTTAPTAPPAAPSASAATAATAVPAATTAPTTAPATSAPTVAAATAPAASVASGGNVVIVQLKDFMIALDKSTVSAGMVTFTIKNNGPSPHNFNVKIGSEEKGVPTLDSGATMTLTLDLKPGTYDYRCNIPGHDLLGMKGTLTVT